MKLGLDLRHFETADLTMSVPVASGNDKSTHFNLGSNNVLLTLRVEFPVAILDQGSSAANEAAVLGATIAFAEELIASIRLRLATPARK